MATKIEYETLKQQCRDLALLQNKATIKNMTARNLGPVGCFTEFKNFSDAALAAPFLEMAEALEAHGNTTCDGHKLLQEKLLTIERDQLRAELAHSRDTNKHWKETIERILDVVGEEGVVLTGEGGWSKGPDDEKSDMTRLVEKIESTFIELAECQSKLQGAEHAASDIL